MPTSIAASKAGRHVLCEKPIGTDVEEIERLRAAVATSGELLAREAWSCDPTL